MTRSPDLLRRHRSDLALYGAALLVPFFWFDRVDGRPSWPAIGVRVAWILALLAMGWAGRRGSARAADLASRLVGPLSALATLGIVAATGGSASGYFGFLFALPFCNLMLLPDYASSAGFSGLLTTVGGFALLAVEGRPAPDLVQWLLLTSAAGVLAVHGSRLYQRIWRRELEAERDRALALEDLARSEQLRARAEQLAIVGRLAAGVAHEINNPLSYVKSNLAWIAAQVEAAPGPETGDELPQVIRDTAGGVTRIAQIVADLREFARDGTDEAERCSPAAAVSEALKLSRLRTHREMPVTVHLEEGLPPVRTSQRRLVQTLVNLIVNAADAVQARRRGDPTAGWIRVEAFAEPGEVSFAVEDGGEGVTAQARDRIFEPFFTTKGSSGTGLGLAISRENVERFGGKLELEQPLHGGGARFRVRLPRAA